MNKKRFSLRAILYNDKLLMLISLLLALVVWTSVSMNVSPDTEKMIKDVSVKIDIDNSTLSQLGLQTFNTSQITINVTVSGKKYAILDVTADDISATALTTNVNSTGKHTLPISVEKTNPKGDFKIVQDSWSPNTVDVYFDTLSEQNMNVEAVISGAENVADGYFMGEAVLSADVVSVSGPTTEFNKIDKIIAKGDIPANATESVTLTPSLIAVDESGNEVNNITIASGKTALSMTIPILKIATMPVSANFLNAPSGITEESLSIAYSPPQLYMAAAESYLSGTSKIKVGDIDFTTLHTGVNTFTFKLADVSGITVLDPNISEVTVSLDMSSFKRRAFTVNTSIIQFTNAPEGYTAKASTSNIDNVTVMGPAASVKGVLPSDITATIDLVDFNVKRSTAECSVKFAVKNHSDCWVVGTYKLNVTLNKQ